MNDFTDKELEQMMRNLGGFKSAEMMIIVSKISGEIERRKELASLDFEDDCLSCKL